MAVSCDSIILGSSAGVIFWFNRANQQVSRKSIDDKFVPVTCAAITVSQYGEVLATGNLQGTLAIYSSNPSYSRPVSFQPFACCTTTYEILTSYILLLIFIDLYFAWEAQLTCNSPDLGQQWAALAFWGRGWTSALESFSTWYPSTHQTHSTRRY